MAVGFGPDEIEKLKHAATGDDYMAQVRLGRCYLYGRGVEKNLEKAAELFKKTAAAGNIDGQVGLGILQTSGKAVPKNPSQALKYFVNAAAKGNTWGLITLAINHSKIGTENDFRKAYQLLAQAVEDDEGVGDLEMRIEAAEMLAIWYGTGKGIAKNPEKQFAYFKKAADLGGSSAKGCVGGLYWYGIGTKRDLKLGYEYYLASAEAGEPSAAVFLGNRFEWGDGFPANFATAAKMFKLAERNGSAMAPILAYRLPANIQRPQETKVGLAAPADLADMIAKMDATNLSALENYDIACVADINNQGNIAIKHFQRIRAAKGFKQLNTSIRRDLKRIEYFRTERMNDYFLALASSAVLNRFEASTIKVFIPGEKDGYSKQAREVILESINCWLEALQNRIAMQETEAEQSCDLRFLPVEKEIFFGTAVARTCYLNDATDKFIAVAKRSVIQLPKSDLISADDRVNFKSICLHEIGHALGLRGHSIFASDVMFSTQTHIDYLSPRDIAAISALYDANAEHRIAAIIHTEIERKSPFAFGRLGLHYHANHREKEAIDLLEKASAGGNESSQFLLGLIYWRKLDFNRAAKLLEKAAEGGVPTALLYRNCLFGLGAKVGKELLDSIQAGVAHGDEASLIMLGTLYTFGDEHLEKDVAKGAALLKQASQQGSTFAKLLLALNTVIASSDHIFGLATGPKL